MPCYVTVLSGLFFFTVSAVRLKFDGGTLTTIDKFPSLCGVLQAEDGKHFVHTCGGAILNHRSVLTAAHCVGDAIPAKYRIRVGSTMANSGGKVHNISEIIIHEKWNPTTVDCDIAILRTPIEIVYNKVVQPASIAAPGYALDENEIIRAAGWGTAVSGGVMSEQLRHIQMETVSRKQCSLTYGDRLTDNMFCNGWKDVGGRNQCSGDSGGPVYHLGTVVGISSLGDGCDPHYPGVNVRVFRFFTWIQENA